MICPNCQAEMQDDVKFCIKCGTRLHEDKKPGGKTPKFCIHCGTSLHEGSRFCTKCGAPVEENTASGNAADNKTSDSEKTAAKTADKAPAVNTADKAPASNTAAKSPAPAAAQAQPGRTVRPAQTSAAAATAATAATASAVTAAAQAQLGRTVRPAQTSAAAATAAVSAPEKKRSSKGIIIVAVLAIAALIVAILLALKSMGVFSGRDSSAYSAPEPQTAVSDTDTPPEDEPGTEETDPEPEVDPEAEAARLKEIEDIKNSIEEAVAAGDASEEISDDYPRAFEGFINLATGYGLAEEISDEASGIFDRYMNQVNNSIALLDGQKVSSGLYIQSRVYLDRALQYANELTDAGITIDRTALDAESAELVERYRDKYIAAINEISSRENWSRDEAWQLADDAASIKDENGSTVLFDEADSDDPLRLRYIYCLAWVTRKNIEKGLADGTMDASGALDEIDRVLPMTDMNPMLLYDAVQYCGKAGVDPASYSAAFDQIKEVLAENEGISLILDHAKAKDNKVDLNHFWYFNDISEGADTAYQVSDFNGTSAETRAWIRENVKVSR